MAMKEAATKSRHQTNRTAEANEQPERIPNNKPDEKSAPE